jgi:S-sulfo-L-cysteine synthase (3-phospho-L-serine-dependent)
MRFDGVIDAIGHTPLIRLALPAPEGVEVYAKLEMQNLFAMKDRVAKQAILDAKRTGLLADGAPIIESSSGTMALGLALVGTALGHPVHIVTDPRIDPITHTKLEALGCDVHVVTEMTSAGWQSARLELLCRLMDDLDGAFWPRQYTNPQNPLAYRALAQELRGDLERIDVLVGAVGSGGSLCGTTRALLDDWPSLRVVGVDCVGSLIFAQPDWPQRRQSGLGNSLQPANVDYSVFDEVHWLNDDEAFHATRLLAREQKIFAGNTSGSVYQVLRHLASRAAPGSTIVGIFPDRGDRYVDSVYRSELGGLPRADEPVLVPYGSPVKAWSYALLGRGGRGQLVFLESNTTGTGMLALRTAARLGVQPVLLTSKPSRYAGLAEVPCRVVECDTNDSAAIDHALTKELAGESLAGITTTSEYYLEPVASLAAAYGLLGNPPETMAICRSKARTRQVLRAGGVAQPAFAVLTDPAQVESAVATVGLPCVVKPADDSGSTNVLLCESATQVAEHAAAVLAVVENSRAQPTAGVVLVEQYLPGPELSAEMFSVGGEAVCVGITEKTVTGLPFFVECQHVFPAALPEVAAAEVEEAARQALKATGFELGASHLELKLTDAGPAIVEINARLAGGMIPELVRLATGVDLLEQQLRAATGLPVHLTPSRERFAGIRFLLAPAAGRLAGARGVAAARRVPGVDRVELTATPGAHVQPARSFADRLGYVIAVGRSHDEVEHTLAEAHGLITVDVDPALGDHEVSVALGRSNATKTS